MLIPYWRDRFLVMLWVVILGALGIAQQRGYNRDITCADRSVLDAVVREYSPPTIYSCSSRRQECNDNEIFAALDLLGELRSPEALASLAALTRYSLDGAAGEELDGEIIDAGRPMLAPLRALRPEELHARCEREVSRRSREIKVNIDRADSERMCKPAGGVTGIASEIGDDAAAINAGRKWEDVPPVSDQWVIKGAEGYAIDALFHCAAERPNPPRVLGAKSGVCSDPGFFCERTVFTLSLAMLGDYGTSATLRALAGLVRFSGNRYFRDEYRRRIQRQGAPIRAYLLARSPNDLRARCEGDYADAVSRGGRHFGEEAPLSTICRSTDQIRAAIQQLAH